MDIAVTFYDIRSPEPTADGRVDVERIYCFDWSLFDAQQYDRLLAVFDSLPGSKLHDCHDCHWWYSDHEDVESGYLTAGVEPPGLQVFGSLLFAEWKVWDREFRRLTVGLPVRSL